MTDTPRPPTPLETAQQRLETAERAALRARGEVASAAVDQERREDGDSAAVDRAAKPYDAATMAALMAPPKQLTLL